MEQLDLLWNLEIHHDSLSTYQKEIFKLRNKFDFDQIENEIQGTEEKLNFLSGKRDKIKDVLDKYNQKLKDYNYKIEEIEKSLYDGNTTDIKQLEYLDKEKDRIKEMINDMETEILELMDEVDNIDIELLLIVKTLEDVKERNKRFQGEFGAEEKRLGKLVASEKKKILELEEEIKEGLLDKYYAIKKNKGTGMAQVRNGVCSGCNMLLPTILLDRLHEDDKIICCENCGRILRILD
ncbi:MAG: C4-type zinc ribbon domain-containing protein [Tissierellaceae bacterium]